MSDHAVPDRLRLAGRPQAYRVLTHLKYNFDCDAKHLSEVAGTSVSSIQVLLVSLARSGLVRRSVPDPTDGVRGRRAFVYSLPEPVYEWLCASESALSSGGDE